MPELTDLDVVEVSLVDKAANKRKFLILKSQGGDAMDNELILNCEDGMEDILKAIALAGDDEAAWEAELKKAKLTDKGMKAVKAALRALNGVKMELPKNILEALARLGGYGYAAPEMEKQKAKEEDMAKQKAKEEEDMAKQKAKDEEEMAKQKKDKEKYGYKMKKDGSPDFDSIPDEVRPMVESLWKQSNEAILKAQATEATLAKERDERLTKEFIQKARTSFGRLSIKADEFGPILKAAFQKLDKAEYEELDRVLRSADEAMDQLFIEKGTSLSDDAGTQPAVIKLEKAAEKIATRDGITREQAFIKALNEYPDLAAQERKERDKEVARR